MFCRAQCRAEGGFQSLLIQALAPRGLDSVCPNWEGGPGNEATAAVSVAREFNLPIHVSFSIETDGRLRGGRSLDEVIREVDRVTANYTTYFGVNCAHPRHIIMALRDLSEDVRSRIGSIRGNASLKSHDELDNSLVLDRGDISVWVQETIGILKMLPELKVVGGCCGTDEEHIDSLAGRIYSAGC